MYTDMVLESGPPRLDGIKIATGDELTSRWSKGRQNDALSLKPRGRAEAEDSTAEKPGVRRTKPHRLATWNVRGMGMGKLDVIKQEMDRLGIEILGVSELKWTGMGHFDSGQYRVYFSGHESIWHRGVAFVVNRSVAMSVLGYETVNDRIITIRIQGRALNLTIIQVYAPTTEASESDIEDFYSSLQETFDAAPSKDIKLLIGDFNAKVGCSIEPSITCRFGLGERNDAGDRLVEFCAENELTITNTLFKQPNRRLYTWTSPDGNSRNQIDYIICQRRWKSRGDGNKQLVSSGEEVKQRWLNYTEALYKKNSSITCSPMTTESSDFLHEMEPEILESEIRSAIAQLPNRKSPGIDGIPIELVKALGDRGTRMIHEMCNEIWRTREWPQQWKQSVYIPIPKKGNPRECGNNRTIALITHASKVLLKVMQRRIEPYMQRELAAEQAGFRKGRETRDQIANLRWILEKGREYNKHIYMCFIDYSKAFDCVDHTLLWRALEDMGVPKHLIVLLRNLYCNQEATVRTEAGDTEWFKIGKGVRQGCILSPYLFNLYTETIMRRAEMDSDNERTNELGVAVLTTCDTQTTPHS